MLEIITAAAIQLAILSAGTDATTTTQTQTQTETTTETTTTAPIGNNGWGDDNN